MNKILQLAAVAALSLVAWHGAAQAQAARTWVSGVGDDVNPCSRTAPCKTFAGAISRTAAGGEIDALDPGGFGAVAITKSIIISGEGLTAGILVSGTNGIIVNAASTDEVVLRGLDINGIGTGLSGIRMINGGKLFVENSQIRNFTQFGIDVQSNVVNIVYLDNTTITNNGGGINIKDGGVLNLVIVDRSHIIDNPSFGMKADGANSKGFVSDSVFATNTTDLVTANGGNITSYGNNVFRNGTPTATLPLK